MQSKDIILVIGVGNMGASIARGLLAQGWAPEQIILCDHRSQRHADLTSMFPGVAIISDPKEAPSEVSIIILAVKPNDLAPTCRHVASCQFKASSVYISIAAGIPIHSLKLWLGSDALIVRSMPNTPAAIGLGITGLYTDSDNEEMRTTVDQVMQSAGKTLWVDSEPKLDAVTALSGSGPAYLFYLMECLQKAGQELGLSKEDCYKLTLQTMLGAAQLADCQDQSFETLRANVTSKGGTTEQAINKFIENDLQAIVKDALKAAAERAKQISQSFEE